MILLQISLSVKIEGFYFFLLKGTPWLNPPIYFYGRASPYLVLSTLDMIICLGKIFIKCPLFIN